MIILKCLFIFSFVFVGKVVHREKKFLMHKETTTLQESYRFGYVMHCTLEKICISSRECFWFYFNDAQTPFKWVSYYLTRILPFWWCDVTYCTFEKMCNSFRERFCFYFNDPLISFKWVRSVYEKVSFCTNFQNFTVIVYIICFLNIERS